MGHGTAGLTGTAVIMHGGWAPVKERRAYDRTRSLARPDGGYDRTKGSLARTAAGVAEGDVLAAVLGPPEGLAYGP